MDILGCSQGVNDLSDIKQAILSACLNEEDDDEADGDDTGDNEVLVEQRHHGNSLQKCLGKFASFPSVASPPEANDEAETALHQIYSEDSIQSPSPYYRLMSLPTPLKLVSALKGSREKQGLPPKKLTVNWAPDVYDPPPTSVLHTVRSKKLQRSKKNNDKKKNGKKGQKGKNSGRCNGKDNKQLRRGGGSSDRSYKPLEVQDRVLNTSGDLNDFKIGSPDPYCGSSYLKNSPATMHYSVAEAL